MKETIEYLIEYKGPGKRRYSRTFTPFKSKEFVLNYVEETGPVAPNVATRIVEQKRKIIKVYPAKNTVGGAITPAASGDKGKVDITAMSFNVHDKKPKNELKTFSEIREYLEKRGAEMFEIKHTATGFSITGLTKDGKKLPKDSK